MFCQKCGKEIMDEAVVCPHCGCATGKVQPNNNNVGATIGRIALGLLLILLGIGILVVFALLVMAQL